MSLSDVLSYRGRSGPRRDGGDFLSSPLMAYASLADKYLWLTGILLVAALMLGGASREAELQLAFLELLSLPVIVLALLRLGDSLGWRRLGIPMTIILGMVGLHLLQLIPLPFEVWSSLPGHAPVASGLVLAGAQPAVAPLSLVPEATMRSLLASLVPIAVFLGACACSADQRKALAALVAWVAGLSILIGVLQTTGGADSSLRFYETTSHEGAVGFFANRNHQATLLVVTIPLLALWVRDLSQGDDRGRLAAWLALAFMGVVVVGVVMTRSRAGLLLIAPAVLGAMKVVWRARRQRMDRGVVGAGAVALLAILAAAMLAPSGLFGAFDNATGQDSRSAIWPSVAQAGQAFMPLGSGLGSFEQVYRGFEPIELIGPFFVNAAHNDYLQIWLEAGVLGLGLVLAIGIWAAWRSVGAWRRDLTGLGQAGGVVVLLIALHSAVDYPLRTPAIAAVFGLACACLIGARDGHRPGAEVTRASR